ncbi:hypothetical protein SPI_00953 [Niveomyces insectorum RCEF 264]|uniref:Uncharacterized protein n=1 Tax=Niveomyces insectorum RCEF 264 TaxID=1081102 RepID=A0A168AHM3_9HYPO|nr:hypothetical protein SPI_00953 [Niveomyces insectorum RCEF 264]
MSVSDFETPQYVTLGHFLTDIALALVGDASVASPVATLVNKYSAFLPDIMETAENCRADSPEKVLALLQRWDVSATQAATVTPATDAPAAEAPAAEAPTADDSEVAAAANKNDGEDAPTVPDELGTPARAAMKRAAARLEEDSDGSPARLTKLSRIAQRAVLAYQTPETAAEKDSAEERMDEDEDDLTTSDKDQTPSTEE